MPDNLFFTTGDTANDRRLQRQAAAEKLRKLYAGVYTDNLSDTLAVVGARHALAIAAHLCGPAILSGRSALRGGPVTTEQDGVRTVWLFLTDPRSNTRRDISMPGLAIRSVPGAVQQSGDYPMLGLVMPSKARAILDNLSPSRARGTGPTRTAGAEEIETRLESLCAQEGEDALNKLRDEARALAPALGLEKAFTTLDGIIGTLLGTRKARLASKTAQAMAAGRAYDADCVNRLIILRRHLGEVALPERMDTSVASGHRVAASFIEAYFSNFIEGTKFPVRQAERIVFSGEIPAQRPKDSHDVLATYQQLVELGGRRPSSLSAQEFLDEIRSRHADLMASRPECLPGQWKVEANVAGNTTFVLPARVEGTLLSGFEMLGGLSSPFARAVFIHFLMADVHPFSDGNGRMARLMMTKELVGWGHSRIVVPTVYRDDYINGMRALTRHGDPGPIVRALDFCQKVTTACASPDIAAAIETWASTFAFVEAGPNARLEMPGRARKVVWQGEIPAPEEYWQADNTAGLPFGA